MTISLARKQPPGDTRSPEQLWAHYVIEKELAAKLLSASDAERSRLYSWTYDELFKRLPDHPQLTRKESPQQQVHRIDYLVRFLSPWLTARTVFLEVGAGDCALSFAVADKVAHVYAIDVSETITSATRRPPNFTLMISDGTSIPVPPGTVNVAFSNQLMEHLHPEDALLQLKNIYRSLAPGGVYVCLTPNRLTGPHDISGYFDEKATGLHLKEYTSTELIEIFQAAGFRSVRQLLKAGAGYAAVPNLLSTGTEWVVESAPPSLRRRLLASRRLRALLKVRLVATK